MGRFFVLFVVNILLLSLNGWSQSYYWIGFSNKNNSPWSLTKPREFLSERALERRRRQNIAIDSLDLPVNPMYVSQVLQHGVSLVHSSKWLNGITVKTTSDGLPEVIMQLPFVNEIQLTKRSFVARSILTKFSDTQLKSGINYADSMNYGESYHQISQLNGNYLHDQNFRGQGMHIAVLDAGFYGVDKFSAFDSLWTEGRILGTWDFVDADAYVFDGHFHGMSVLSAMGGNIPGKLIGTAPKASYWLLRSEDDSSEFLIEEDNWIAAAEFADSAGVDVINSSLGYSTFDDPAMNHTYSDMDGNTTRVTRGANLAASRGILVVSSAGNEGRPANPWKYIVAPSDGEQVIGVGAVNKTGIPATFTSYGPASDGAVKPNVTAVGWNTILQNSNGTVGAGNGTSYSSPVMAGASACLWQANPISTAAEVKSALEKSAHLYHSPDSLMGYGIPDLKLADRILKSGNLNVPDTRVVWWVYPNPAVDYLVIQKRINNSFGKIHFTIYSLDGKLMHTEEKPDAAKITLRNLKMLPPGMFLLHIQSKYGSEVVKINKSR